MSLQFTIIRAAHASGTHHKLALDALLHLSGPDAEKWQRLFLANAKSYVEGSKAPDNEFKDFKNHVLHPSDDYWGGAPEKARNWYAHLVEALHNRKWSEAAWCAGILSHYFTDPLMPFHTAQSEAENAIHRATEWSISKSYDGLVGEAAGRKAVAAPQPAQTDGWLQDYVCLGAETSHAEYERLIAHYDINTGVVSPEKGLDPVARRLIGDLLVYARTGFAHLLDRAIAEAGFEPPTVSLTASSLLATLKVPVRFMLNRIEDAATRREVAAMYDELMATGRVEKTLPEDDRAVRDLHNAEIAAPRAAARAAERAKRLKSGKEKSARQTLLGIAPAKRASAAKELESLVRPAPAPEAVREKPKTDLEPATSRTLTAQLAVLQPAGERYRLALPDAIEAAPSIGPKTAERLGGLGLLTVSDLMQADPAKIAANLGDSRINAATVEGWQDESRLMLTIPGLRVTQSQLLVGAGYRYTEDIAEAEPESLAADILAFAATHSGRRLLRDGEPPDIEKIKAWIDAAHASSQAA
ncbi:MAG: DUF4332 domain-containing protein [Alphaproteobacteria bacterium]|nr:DUF4332 domain-containing protein [Alphaproteobacteria bacterium]